MGLSHGDLAPAALHRDRAAAAVLVGDPEEAALLLAACGADEELLCAARALDVVRAPRSASRESEEPNVRLLVRAAHALGVVRWLPSGRTPASHARAALFAMAGGHPRVLMLAMAERTSALRRAGRSELPAACAAAHEGRALWAPLAGRLSVHQLQRELEDLSFRLIEPRAYDDVVRLVARRRSEREALVERAADEVALLLRENGLACSVDGRAKHLYSVHKKRLAGGGQVDLSDLFGLRVVIPDDDGCYAALGLIHARWEHLSHRYKDFIARPKPNGYQSLHTVVLLPIEGAAVPIEVQIRTRTMHELAENGAAAHWRYKRMSFRIEPEERWIYPLTPRGEVKRLPSGATPLDFAYAVHTEVGRGCFAARAGGKLTALDTPLRTGVVVEIMRRARSHVSAGQLGRVRTRRARNRIRAALA